MNRMLTNKELAVLLFFGGAVLLGISVTAWREWRVANATAPPVMIAPQELAPQEAAPEGRAAQDAVPQDPVPKHLAPQDPPAAAPAPKWKAPTESSAVAPMPQGASAEPSGPALVREGAPDSEPEVVVVAVAGAVREPGVYELAAGTRLADLLRMAGLADDADTEGLNLAAPLLDGSWVTVPIAKVRSSEDGVMVLRAGPSARDLNLPHYTGQGPPAGPDVEDGRTPPAAAQTGSAAAQAPSPTRAPGPINLNTATQAELETLPGIGPVTAAKIIAFREQTPFTRVTDLEQVSGIGPKRLDAVRDLVTAP